MFDVDSSCSNGCQERKVLRKSARMDKFRLSALFCGRKFGQRFPEVLGHLDLVAQRKSCSESFDCFCLKVSERPLQSCQAPRNGTCRGLSSYAPNQQVVPRSPQVSRAHAFLRVLVNSVIGRAQGSGESVANGTRPPLLNDSPGAHFMSQWLCQQGMLNK